LIEIFHTLFNGSVSSYFGHRPSFFVIPTKEGSQRLAVEQSPMKRKIASNKVFQIIFFAGASRYAGRSLLRRDDKGIGMTRTSGGQVLIRKYAVIFNPEKSLALTQLV